MLRWAAALYRDTKTNKWILFDDRVARKSGRSERMGRREEVVSVRQTFSQKRMQQVLAEQTVHVPVPHVKGRGHRQCFRSRTRSGADDGAKCGFSLPIRVGVKTDRLKLTRELRKVLLEVLLRKVEQVHAFSWRSACVDLSCQFGCGVLIVLVLVLRPDSMMMRGSSFK